MKISIVIPAKSSSERVQNKNLTPIKNKSLALICCEKVLQCKNVDSVYIDTDDERIINQISHLKDIKIIKRPTELANNNLTGNDLMVYALHSIEECDLMLQTFVTSPLITSETIDKCIDTFLNTNRKHDSFFTVTKMQEYFWGNDDKPINFDLDKLPNSFELEEQYMETHGLYGIYSDSLLQHKRRVGSNPLKICIPKKESFDINDHEDLEIIKLLYND
ncbi:MAG: acylneuraminate cytidylyltransferase family protein [Candidatus Hodarchaeales archaeon]|jgi:CMP-N-acetylneuraminic acid synthetase